MNTNMYKYAGYASVAGLLLLIPYVVVSFANGYNSEINSQYVMWEKVLLVLGSLTSLIVGYGFIKLAQKYNNQLLLVSAYILIAGTILLFIADLAGFLPKLNPSQKMNFTDGLYAVSLLALQGGIYILFGIALLKLKDKLGSVAKSAGITHIIAGSMYISLILSPFAALLEIPITILIAILFFREADKDEGTHKSIKNV